MSDQNIELGQLASSPASESTSVDDNDYIPAQHPNLDGETTDGDGTPGDERVIFINRAQPPVTKYVNNSISTAKYSVIRFIPLFLFEQFRRWANIFFLMIALLQQIPDVSPTGRYTTLVPLIFILSVSAVKEIIEDWKRHRADDETNFRKVEVLRGASWISICWKDVVVGDIVKVINNQFFPADLILLSSSEPQGMSFIETSNLDGETNLKIRQALPVTSKITSATQLRTLSGTIICEPPNRHLYQFNGVIKLENQPPHSLGPDQILLRGAMLRNTAWIYGFVIYTGHETKLMKNSTKVPLKRSTVDKATNIQILLLFGILLLMTIISSIFNLLWHIEHVSDWYIGKEAGEHGKEFGFNLITFLILYNNLIPISLQVTLEVVRFIQAIFINMDIEMYHEESNTPAMARTSNLNEELGQVKYVFSDKTGTLTQNVMEFKRCAIGHQAYGITDTPEESLLVQHLNANHENAKNIKELLILLSVCHTVIPEIVDGKMVYHAASPDERALVNGASKYGYIFETRTPDYVEVNAHGEKQRYQILSVLEFTSSRKRMSVIIRNPDGQLKLYCKGADKVIYERLDKSEDREKADVLLQHLETFANDGLRTLVCAYADIKQSFFDEWIKVYNTATCAIRDREDKIADACDLIEKDLRLIGATAIEDKLQDGVPETISSLLAANIYIWVLTGDKQETAINIGYSTKLLSFNMRRIIMNETGLDATRDAIRKHSHLLGLLNNDSNSSTNSHNHRRRQDSEELEEIALIIDGTTLTYALSCELRDEFLRLCVACKVVICCRVSPIQKAEVVEYVTHYTKAVTLAIGDGANDVAMIQKAHVGVGISGMEGLQAACASDYSIAQFRFLKRLLLVHGAWNYSRMCKLILYSFYKNICLYVIELWFAIYSAWSGQILFERWSIGFYNVAFTALPPFAMGLFDQPCSAKKMMSNPSLYKTSQSGELFNVKVFWIWIVNGIVHSAILYWLTLFICQNDVLWINGKSGGFLVTGNAVYTYVVIATCLKAGLVVKSWNLFTHIAIWGSILLWLLYVIVYSLVWPTLPVGAIMAGMFFLLYSTAVYWLGMFLVPTITLLPDFLVQVIQSTLFKSLLDEVREEETRKNGRNNYRGEAKNSLSEKARLLKNVFTRRTPRVDLDVEMSHGFAFSQEEGGAVSQTDVIRAYDTNVPKPGGN